MVAETDRVLDRAVTLGGYGRGDGEIELVARRKYGKLYGQADGWCRSRGLVPMPMSSETLAVYCRWMVREAGYSVATALAACTAVRWKHRVKGEKPPDRVPAWYVLLDLEPTGRGRGEWPFRAACRDDLAMVAEVCDQAAAAGVRDLVAVVLAYGLGVGEQELAVLRVEHLDVGAGEVGVRLPVVGPSGWVRQTLTCRGWHRAGASPSVGARYGCPGCVVRLWLAELAGQGVARGPLLRPVDKLGRVGGAPVHTGQTAAGGGLAAVKIRKVIAETVRRADLDEAVSRRSLAALRVGSAREAHAAGAGPGEVAARAGYRRGSATLARYLMMPDLADETA